MTPFWPEKNLFAYLGTYRETSLPILYVSSGFLGKKIYVEATVLNSEGLDKVTV